MKWPKDLLEKIIDRALAQGSAKVVCDSQAEARLLRYALYNHRKGPARQLRITVEAEQVTVCKPILPEAMLE